MAERAPVGRRDAQHDRGDQTLRRLASANRASSDRVHLPADPAGRRVDVLEVALVQSRQEAAALQGRLDSVLASTSWRLTRPLRWCADWLQRSLSGPAERPPLIVARPGVTGYAEWIDRYEPSRRQALTVQRPGNRAAVSRTLGLIILPGPLAAAALARLLADCPDGCHVLRLHRPGDQQAALDDEHLVSVPVGTAFRPSDAVAIATAQLGSDLLCFLDPADTPASGALALVASQAARRPDADVIYADEDWAVRGERADPFFKPDWDEDLQATRDLLGPFTFLCARLLRDVVPCAGPAWRYDLANAVIAASRPDRILHIPAVLCHRAGPAAMLQHAGAPAVCRARPGEAGRPPVVSVIVPIRDRADLLAVCADGLLQRTAYEAIELVIVDNGSTEPATLALLETLMEDARVQVLHAPGPFNWSALNNRAAAVATGDVLLLLNNDIDVLHPDWLGIMVALVQQPGIGAVGAKLLYPDGRVQHAGLTTDLTGAPHHLCRFAADDRFGPFGLLADTRQVWALTGACLAICRDAFASVGGLNEALPVTCNDVDLCLRLTLRGYRLLWTPHATLTHHELATRTPDHLSSRRDQAREELDHLLRDWGRLALHDPFLNANIVIDEGQPRLRC